VTDRNLASGRIWWYCNVDIFHMETFRILFCTLVCIDTKRVELSGCSCCE